jgi:hypothetical protein
MGTACEWIRFKLIGNTEKASGVTYLQHAWFPYIHIVICRTVNGRINFWMNNVYRSLLGLNC